MINVIGNIFGSSGYSQHTRYLANSLSKLTDVSLQTQLFQGFETSVNDAELEMIKRESDNKTNLIITHPLFWRTNCYAKQNIVYLIWEGDKIPKWLVNECLNSNIDKIICPSRHTYNALREGFEYYDPDAWHFLEGFGIDKIAIIPHGVNLEIFKPNNQRKKDNMRCSNVQLSGDTKLQKGKKIKNEQMPNEVENHADFRFLANKGLTSLEDRGGIQYLIRAYLDEFKPKENVELILKINPAYGIPNLLKMFPELTKKIPKIKLITEDYTSKQLNDLYNECDLFVSPTRAEAFNLPCLEAMACGKPVITTNYGGQIDFIDIESGWLIDYKLVNVEHDISYEECKWATPEQKDLRKKLRFAFENQDICKSMSKHCINIAKSLTWDKTAKQIHSLINNGILKM